MQNVINLSEARMGIYRDGKAAPIAREPGPPPRIDGYIVGWTEIAPDAPPRHTGSSTLMPTKCSLSCLG